MTVRRRVVVLGGGMGALSAAHSLTATPALRARHDVTVYAPGFRLGGQAASGRGVHQRIEEHGLHLLPGFYENLFAMMRQVYAERGGQGTRGRSFDDAVLPVDLAAVTFGQGPAQRVAALTLPRNGRTPGAPAADDPRPGDLLRLVRSGARSKLRGRDGAVLASLVARCSLGVARDRLLERGFGAVDGEDFRAWLRRHGASEDVAESPYVGAIYDFIFSAPQDGTPTSGLSAAVALRFAAQLFGGYQGSAFFLMRGGTGDVLFAPLYRALVARGVRFHFFSRLTQLELSADGTTVSALGLARAAAVRRGAYEPLVPLDGLDTWPAAPLEDQLDAPVELRPLVRALDNGLPTPAEEPFRLLVERDFDDVVLGVPLAALPAVAPTLFERHACWRAAQAVESVPTVAVQLWSAQRDSSLPDGALLNTGAAPFRAVGVMRHLLDEERHGDGRPAELWHACGRAPAGGVDAEAARWAPGERLGRAEVLQRLNDAPSERYVLSVPGSSAARIRPDDCGVRNLFPAGTWTACGVDAGKLEGAVLSGWCAAQAIAGEGLPVLGLAPRALPFTAPAATAPSTGSVHRALLHAPREQVFAALQQLGGPNDDVFPRRWRRLQLDAGVRPFSSGGFGVVRAVVARVVAPARIELLVGSVGFEGRVSVVLEAVAPARTEVSLVTHGRARRWYWRAVGGPLHDAVMVDWLRQLVATFGGALDERRSARRVGALRAALGPLLRGQA